MNGLAFDSEIPMYRADASVGRAVTKASRTIRTIIKGSAKRLGARGHPPPHRMDTGLEVVGDESRNLRGIVQTYAGPADPAPQAKNPR